MRTPYFFIPPLDERKDRLLLDGEESYHLAKVLKIRPGRLINLLDGNGTTYQAKVLNISGNNAEVEVISERKKVNCSPSLWVGFVLPRRRIKTEMILDGAIEFGINTITPLLSERGMVKFNTNNPNKKLSRWRLITREAAKRSGNPYLPSIYPPLTLMDFMDKIPKASLKIILSPEQGVAHVRDVLGGSPRPDKIVLLAGPEGGFTPKECEYAVERGFEPCSLGRMTLRIETAVIASLAIINYVYKRV